MLFSPDPPPPLPINHKSPKRAKQNTAGRFRAKREHLTLKGFKDLHLKARTKADPGCLICGEFARQPVGFKASNFVAPVVPPTLHPVERIWHTQ